MDERTTMRRGPLLWLGARSWKFRVVAALFPALYVGSIGPMCWSKAESAMLLTSIEGRGKTEPTVPAIYAPIGWAARNGWSPIRRAIEWWITLGMRPDDLVLVPGIGPGDGCGFYVQPKPTP